MKYTTLALVLGLGAFSPAFSADWTNFLKGMQNDCETYTLREKLQKKTSIPKALQTNISKYTTKAGADGQKSVDIRLKNATAFGKAITRIYLDNSEWGYRGFHVYFNDGNFNALKPKFPINVNGQTYSAGVKKAWIEEEHYNEQTNKSTYTIKSISYKGGTRKPYEALMNDYEMGTLVVVHDNGWWRDSMSWGAAGDFTELTFDSKNKRISCEQAFG